LSLNPHEVSRVLEDVSTRTLSPPTTGVTIAVVEPPDDQLTQLYRAHAPAARRLAYLLVGDREEADDLVQDCFVRLAARRRVPVDDLPAYLRRAVVNAANSWMRKRAVRRRRAHEAALAYGPGGVGDAVSPDASASVVRDDALRRALLALPERQRTAVVLRHYLDLSEAECAELMDCSVGTVKAAASRGRTRLAELLGGRDG
jgi:RNA polymerase sigma-70 factor (sigma-E family)